MFVSLPLANAMSSFVRAQNRVGSRLGRVCSRLRGSLRSLLALAAGTSLALAPRALRTRFARQTRSLADMT
jgi:hypothetical protein